MSIANVTHEPTCTAWLWGGIGGLASELCVCNLQPEPTYSRDDVLCRAWQAGLEDSTVDVVSRVLPWLLAPNVKYKRCHERKRVGTWHISVGNV